MFSVCYLCVQGNLTQTTKSDNDSPSPSIPIPVEMPKASPPSGVLTIPQSEDCIKSPHGPRNITIKFHNNTTLPSVIPKTADHFIVKKTELTQDQELSNTSRTVTTLIEPANHIQSEFKPEMATLENCRQKTFPYVNVPTLITAAPVPVNVLPLTNYHFFPPHPLSCSILPNSLSSLQQIPANIMHFVSKEGRI